MNPELVLVQIPAEQRRLLESAPQTVVQAVEKALRQNPKAQVRVIKPTFKDPIAVVDGKVVAIWV